jgi:hypothetical protein
MFLKDAIDINNLASTARYTDIVAPNEGRGLSLNNGGVTFKAAPLSFMFGFAHSRYVAKSSGLPDTRRQDNPMHLFLLFLLSSKDELANLLELSLLFLVVLVGFCTNRRSDSLFFRADRSGLQIRRGSSVLR